MRARIQAVYPKLEPFATPRSHINGVCVEGIQNQKVISIYLHVHSRKFKKEIILGKCR
jgi:hypothetical protein